MGDTAQVITREDNTSLPADPLPPLTGGIVLRAVTLGRLVPVKGIEELLLSLVESRDRILLDIYGPEEDIEYARRCHAIGKSMPSNVEVNFKGSLNSSLVRETLNHYEVLLHPTRGENFSHIIAEALSSSLPVMCADVTPWTTRLRGGGGIVLPDNSRETWTQYVSEYARLSPTDRFTRRVEAAIAYTEWRKATGADQHIFEQIEQLHRVDD